MWTELRKEIETIRKDFTLSDNAFRPVGLNEWQTIEETIYQTFCKLTHDKSRPLWLWEHFKLDTCRVVTEQLPYIYLNELIDEQETVWFLVNDEHDKFWLYEGLVKPIQTVIAESCYIDEL